MPKVSVIIPVYNVEKYIAKCLDSVLDQTLQDIEILCVEDKSTDGSLSILQEYAQKDNRITLITNNTNQGASTSRNIALKVAKADYITFIDSDDYVNSNYLEILYFEAITSGSDLVFTDTTIVSGLDKTYPTNNYNILKENYFKDITKKMNLINLPMFNSPGAKLFKKELLNSNSLYFIKKEGYNGFGEDFLFIIKALYYAKQISYRRDGIYYYITYNSNSVCSLPQRQKQNNEDRIIIINEIFQFLTQNNIQRIARKSVLKYSLEFLNWSTDDIILKFIKQMDNRYHLNEKIKFIILYLNRKFYFPFLLQKIFSVKNSPNKTHKVITICGIKIKLKRKQYV